VVIWFAAINVNFTFLTLYSQISYRLFPQKNTALKGNVILKGNICAAEIIQEKGER
jgi:hypothetical protein